ncbi:MAG TPA: outer membrane protein assembly factor BamE [Steroidobacteraceae bacterium]|jgi:outer membrane protein assembly factor BamE (lipoprotein component of BamABCDE complex)|nr:outer membrane protein assembly factor BamE [Steroidobacteraceae bacterium]
MRNQLLVSCAGLALSLLGATAARSEDGWSQAVPPPARIDTISAATLAQVKPGSSTKTEVKALLGEPWRILQFNDCGMSMPGQADETWDYRGKNAKGTYRVHIEFDDNDVASLVAKIPDHATGTKGTPARVAPGAMKMAMKM